MPVARRLTLTLLQEGHLCFALCWTSARANFFFKLGPYRAPNLFVDDIFDYEWGCPDSNRGSMVFLCLHTQTISDSYLAGNPRKLSEVSRGQATLQPHDFIYKGFGNFANLQISKPRKFSISVWFLLISLNPVHFSAVLKGLWCKKNLF